MFSVKNYKKYILLFLFICFFYCFSSAQFAEKCPEHEYILKDISELETYNHNSNLENFFVKLNNNSEKINIVHIGASHVQAGYWTFGMRTLFEEKFDKKNTSLGLVFPYNIAKNNNCPYYYEFSHEGKWEISKITDSQPKNNIGIMGITASTNDSVAKLSFKINKRIKIENYKFNKITIFHNAEDTNYVLNLSSNILIGIKNKENNATTFFLNDNISDFDLTITKKDALLATTFLFYGALLENTESDFMFFGIGVNGASTNSYLKANFLFDQLSLLKPNLVIFSIGINDAVSSIFTEEVYFKNYNQLIDSILHINPECAIILTTNNDFYNYKGKWNPNQDSVASVMCRLSDKFDLSVWDMYKIMGGEKSINKWRDDKLAQKDRIHFTKDGYFLLANLFFEALTKQYNF